MNPIIKLLNSARKTLTRDSIQDFTTQGSIEQALTGDFADIRGVLTYKQSLYLTAGLRLLKDVAGAVDFSLYEITNTKGELKEIESHPILDILYKPNPLQTKLEFWRLLIESFVFSKDIFIKVIKTGALPEMLIIIDPSEIEVKFDSVTGSLVFKHNLTNGEQRTYTPLEMVHIKDSDIRNQLRGRSDLAPVLDRIKAEIAASDYQQGIFAKGNAPDIHLNVKGVSSESDLKKIKASFINSFTGKNETARVAVTGGESTVTQFNNSANQLDYTKSKDSVRDDVMMALGVPKSLVTSDNVNRANADAGLQQFMQFTIAPMYKLILEALNERFIIPHYGEKYYLETEKLITEDKELLFKEIEVSVNGRNQILTVNEARTRLGYDVVEGKDDLSVYTAPLNQAPIVNNSLFKTRPNLYNELKLKELTEKILERKAISKLSDNPKYRKMAKSLVNDARDKAETKLAKQTRAFFKQQHARILDSLDKAGEVKYASDIFDIVAENKETELFAEPLFKSTAQTIGNIALTPVKLLSKKNKAYTPSQSTLRKISDRASLFSASITATTYKAIAEVVSENIEGGIPAIKLALETTFFESYIGRVDLIARTESCYLTGLGTQQAYADSPAVSGKQWSTTGDDLVRPEHAQVDGEIVDVNASFSNGESFAGDGSINCRCVILPVVDISNL